MSERQPWECPRCGKILGPHVDEHVCDPPPDGGVLVTAGAPPSAPAMSAGNTPAPAIHVHVTGTVLTSRELAAAVRRDTLRYATRNPRGGLA